MGNEIKKTRKYRRRWGLRYELLSLKLRLACKLAHIGARWATSSSAEMQRILRPYVAAARVPEPAVSPGDALQPEETVHG